MHSLRELGPKAVPAPALGAAFFSPDGRWIGFLSVAEGNSAIRKMALEGGPPETVCRSGIAYGGETWAANDMIYFVSEPASRREHRRRLDATRGDGDRPRCASDRTGEAAGSQAVAPSPVGGASNERPPSLSYE